MIKFVQYFYYLATNWNIAIAWHIIQNEIKGEKHYGINTTGADQLNSVAKKGVDISHATIYMPVSYDVLEEFFTEVQLHTFTHFVDIGSGMGRAMCVAAHYKVPLISGVELSTELYNIAKTNIANTSTLVPNAVFKLYNNDAFYFEIESNVDCIFMFNPFDDTIMSAVLHNIGTSLHAHPRDMTIIYINPLQQHLFIEHGYEQVYHSKKMHYLEGSIFVKLNST